MIPNKRMNTPELDDARRRRNALWISAITTVTMVVITIFVLAIIRQEKTNDWTVPFLTGLLAVAALFSLWLSYRGQASSGITLILGGMLTMTIMLPYLAPGQVLAPALASIIMTITIASATLPNPWPLRVGILSATLAIIIIVVDQFLPSGFGIQSSSTGNIQVSAGLVIVYAIIVLRRYGSYNLRTKILVAFVFVAFIPLAILGTYNTFASRQFITQQGQANLSDLAQNASDKADTYIQTQLDAIRVEAQQPSIIAYMELPSFERRGSVEESNALRTLNTYVRKDPVFIYSYALLDVSGRNILDTVESQIEREEKGAGYFQTPFSTGLPFVSTALFTTGDKATVYISAPVRNLSGDIIGILRGEYNMAAFQNLMRSLLLSQADQSQQLILVDNETFVRVAYTGQRDLLYKSLYNYGPVDMAVLQSAGRLPPGTVDDAIAVSDEIVDGIQHLGDNPFFYVTTSASSGRDMGTAVPLRTVKWTAVALQSENILYAPAREQSRAVVLISIGLVLLAVIAALIAAQFISAPVLSLTSIANKLATGDLTARATSNTQDEIGELAHTFNHMSEQLSQTLGGLESRVAERTIELEAARRQSESRAHDLEIISDVARVISGEQKLENLLPLITNLVSENFNHYHSGIFLLDTNNQFAILQAANSEGGRRMLARGHRLEVGHTSIVGYVAQSGQPRIALDVGADAVFFNNPDLPATRSEIALPLNARSQTIGVLDVQSVQPGAFTNDDLNTLSILADQIAIAIDNARLFGQSENALAEVQSVYRQYISQEWHGFSRRNQGLGYHQSVSGGNPILVEEYTPAMRAALEKGEVVTLPPAKDNETSILAIPVKLRGQPIGFINIQTARKSREWSADEVSLVQAVGDRLALSLENARLFEESTRRAELERMSAEISGRIGSSMNLESILQITAQELSQALGGGTEVLVQIQPGTMNTHSENPPAIGK